MEITPNHILHIGFGLVAAVTFLLAAFMPYGRPGERLIPLLIAAVGVVGWIEWVFIDPAMNPLPVYDFLILFLAFVSLHTNSGYWRIGMIAATAASIVNFVIMAAWTNATYDVKLAMIVLNNMLGLVQSFFVIVAATRHSLNVWTIRRRNTYDYFAKKPRTYVKRPPA